MNSPDRDHDVHLPGLAARLLLAQAIVVLAGAVTAWIVAVAVGPPLFRAHLEQAGAAIVPAEARHAEEAFRSASALSLAVALLAALATGLAVSLYVSRRIARSVGAVATAATALAEGRYDTRVPPAGLGAEFEALTTAFNDMADQLRSVETTRQRLLADLGHEMRTPLATLDAYLEGIEDGVTTLDADTAAVLRAQTRRLGRLAEDIGAVSRAEERRLDLHRQRVKPANLVIAAVNAVRDRYVASGVDLDTQVAADMPIVHVDPERMGQVLGNLLDNALRHTPSGGTVTVVARGVGRDVEFVVSDTGEGIRAEHLPHVFERFYRADSARDRMHGGSGIGLTIAKALVEAHGGQIAAASASAGRGSTFSVRLPAR